jgi:hypothetical protein
MGKWTKIVEAAIEVLAAKKSGGALPAATVPPKTLPTDEASRMARAQEMGFDPQTYYHGTVSDIKSFEPQEKYYLKPGISKHLAIFPGDYEKRGGEFIHFGSAKAAAARLEGMRFNENIPPGQTFPGAQIYPVKLISENPLKLKDNLDVSWNADGILKRIGDEIGMTGATGVTKNKKALAANKFNISEDELSVARIGTRKNQYDHTNLQFDGVPFNQAEELYEGGKDRWIVDFLDSKGFDSIEYKNVYEDPGSVSKIVFEPSQVRSVHAKFDPSKAKSGNILASVPAAVGLLGYGALGALGEENGQSSN